MKSREILGCDRVDPYILFGGSQAVINTLKLLDRLNGEWLGASTEELAKALGVCRRTVLRYIYRIKSAGIPVEEIPIETEDGFKTKSYRIRNDLL